MLDPALIASFQAEYPNLDGITRPTVARLAESIDLASARNPAAVLLTLCREAMALPPRPQQAELEIADQRAFERSWVPDLSQPTVTGDQARAIGDEFRANARRWDAEMRRTAPELENQGELL